MGLVVTADHGGPAGFMMSRPGPRPGRPPDPVAARLAAAGLAVSALALRRPTLEDAFLALTGQAPPPAALPGPGRGGQAAAASPASAQGSTR